MTLKTGAGPWIVGDILVVERKKKAGRASKAGHLIYINLLQHAPRADVDGTGFGGNGLPRRVYLALFGLDAGRQVNTHFRCQIIL